MQRNPPLEDIPAEGETELVGRLMPLSFGVWRLILPRGNGLGPDVIDFLVTNARSDLGAGGSEWIRNPEVFTLDIGTTPHSDDLSLRYGTNELDKLKQLLGTWFANGNRSKYLASECFFRLPSYFCAHLRNVSSTSFSVNRSGS